MTNVEILDGRRDAGDSYKVDVSRGGHNGRVSSEWFSRPDDEKFLSLSDLYASVKGRAERSRTRTVESAAIRVEAHRDDPEKLALVLPDAETPVAPTHWSFGQLASLVSAPAAYLRQLPAPLSALSARTAISGVSRTSRRLVSGIPNTPPTASRTRRRRRSPASPNLRPRLSSRAFAPHGSASSRAPTRIAPTSCASVAFRKPRPRRSSRPCSSKKAAHRKASSTSSRASPQLHEASRNRMRASPWRVAEYSHPDRRRLARPSCRGGPTAAPADRSHDRSTVDESAT